MPTSNRHAYVGRAINCFLKQDYAAKELIIIDDGEQGIGSLMPTKDDRIKYFRLEERKLLIGNKRNYACAAAQGEIIAHFDDDDWYAQDWIRMQVKALTESGSDICGLSSLFFYNHIRNEGWKYVYSSTLRPWVAGATLAYKRDFWERNPFKNVQVGEDNTFVFNPSAKVFSHEHIRGFVATIHPQNTSRKACTPPRWIPHPVDDILSIASDITLRSS